MYKSTLTLLALVASSTAWTVPVEYVEERHVVQINKRQADVSQLLQLASLAGITALPTDPAVLLQLGPLANSLASALPTSSVLSVLLTAAPSGFVSNIVNDPSYAASFESAFSAGSSPSWFNGLPTDVRSYLHTYSGFGGLATAAGAIKGVTSSAGAEATGGNGTVASRTSGASGMKSTLDSSASMASVSSMSASSAVAMGATSVASTEGNTASAAAPAASGTSSSAKAGAAPPTRAIAASLVGAVGILAVAVAL